MLLSTSSRSGSQLTVAGHRLPFDHRVLAPHRPAAQPRLDGPERSVLEHVVRVNEPGGDEGPRDVERIDRFRFLVRVAERGHETI